MDNYSIVRIGETNPHLHVILAGELNGLNRLQRAIEPRIRETRAKVVRPVCPTYNNRGNLYYPRQPQIDYSA